jgi:hypothetical protein
MRANWSCPYKLIHTYIVIIRINLTVVMISHFMDVLHMMIDNIAIHNKTNRPTLSELLRTAIYTVINEAINFLYFLVTTDDTWILLRTTYLVVIIIKQTIA